MKKVLKKVVSVSLALVVAASGINYTSPVDAATTVEEWKQNAVITPGEGSLIGAGYIDVEFDNSMEGYTYTVYLDGKPMYWNGDDIVRTDIGEEKTDSSVIKHFTSEDTGKTEVYTTTVSKHELTVKAEKEGSEVVSDTRTFYVSKKGLALGDDMTDKIALKDLNCSWYYNWGTKAFDNDVDKDVAHIPMMWGNRLGDEPNNKEHKNDIEDIQNLSTKSNYILGFNEPDIPGQANMFFYDAIGVWNQYIAPLNMRKVAPAPAAPGGNSGWLAQFMYGEDICKSPKNPEQWVEFRRFDDNEFAQSTHIRVNGVLNDENAFNDVDAVVLHFYQDRIDLEGLKGAVETLWNSYHLPIWVTEISVFGTKNTSRDYSYEIPQRRQEMANYVNGIVEALDAYPFVERYCWFSYNIDSTNDIDSYNGSGATSMFEFESGLYTELGRLYSTIGNPEGYNATTIPDEKMFVFTGEERTLPENTTVPVTTVAESTTVAPTVTKKVDNTTEKSTKKPISKVSKPGTVKLKKAKSLKKRAVQLTWGKASGAKKYEIQYALDKKFTKKLKKKICSAVTLKISKLTAKKKYYFRVRAINSAGKGSWSNIKTAKAKK